MNDQSNDHQRQPSAEDHAHYDRCGAIGIVCRDSRMLIIRRSINVIAPLLYCFPGGGIEPGETESAALIREFHEELGVTIRPLRRLAENVTPWNVHLAWWSVDLPDDQHLCANPDEVHSVHWMTLAELLAEPDMLESNRPILESIGRGEIRIE